MAAGNGTKAGVENILLTRPHPKNGIHGDFAGPALCKIAADANLTPDRGFHGEKVNRDVADAFIPR